MDNTDFDNLIREKLENGKGLPFKQSSLDQFHEKMNALQPAAWYQNYRTQLFIAAAVLFTSLNISAIWFGLDWKTEQLIKSEVSMRHQIDSLSLIIQKLQDVKITSALSSLDVPRLLNGHDSLSEIIERNKIVTSKSTHKNPNSETPIIASSNISRSTLQSVTLNNRNSDARYLLEPADEFVVEYRYDTSGRQIQDQNKVKLHLPKATINVRLSNKIVNKMEDHKYVSGLGIYLAPHLDFVKAGYPLGTGGFSPRVGFSADWIFSPRWSIETSLDYLTTSWNLKKNFQSISLPNVSTDLGALENAKILTRTISLPVAFKYRFWISHQHQLVFKAGYTPYFTLQSKYEYSYPYPGRPAESDLSIKTLDKTDERKFYGSTISLSAGITKSLKKNNRFETSVFYEKSLDRVGAEALNMQLYGIRTGFWFKGR